MSSQPIVINIGAIPNDGTGDPLRTAFNDVNLNFANVFAYGPVLSNVQIANNTILTTNTNGNLVLAPNGIGIVQSNVSIVPNTANIRNLGSSTQRWATVYSQYLNVSGTVSLTDLTVNGNLTVVGNTIQIGNITTETKTIQLANAASTANAANGSGVTVGSNDDIATLLYNATGNIWTTNIGISSVGNITAPYFFGNGSLLTGVTSSYGNANVVTLLTGFGSNAISTTGNVTAGNFITSGIISATGNVRGANFNTVGLVSATGNITGNYFIGNGSQLTGISTASTGNLEITGTLIEIAAGATETSIVISPSGPTGGQAFVDVPDNVTANTANLRIYNSLGNIEFGTNDGTNSWYFDNTGNLNLPTNGDLNFNGGSIAQTLNEDIYIRASDDENDGWSVYNVVDDGAGNILSQTRLEFDQYTVRTDAQGAAYTWAFRNSGLLELPGDIGGNVGGNLTIKIGDQSGSDTFIDLQTRSYIGDALISNIRIANPDVTISTASAAYNWTFDGTNGFLTFPRDSSNVSTDPYLVIEGGGTPSIQVVDASETGPGNLGIVSNYAEFSGYNGNTVTVYADEGQISSSYNLQVQTPSGIPNSTANISSPGGGYNTGSYTNLATTGGSGTGLTVNATATGGYIDSVTINTPGTGYTNGDTITMVGGDGNGCTFTVGVSANDWAFTTTGNLNLPIGGKVVGQTANNNGYINWVGNSSGDGYGYTTLELHPDDTAYGDAYLIIDPTAPNHIHIRAGGTQDDSGAQLFLGGENSYFLVENGANSNVYVASNSNQWKFDTTGVLTVPGEGIIQSLNDTVILQSNDTVTGNIYSARLGTNGGLYFATTQYPSGWLDITNNAGNANITSPMSSGGAAGHNLNLTAGATDTGAYTSLPGGNLNLAGGTGGFNDDGIGGAGGSVNITAGAPGEAGNVAGNVTVNSGTNTWNFDSTGGLALATVADESAKFVGTRKIIGGLSATSPYSVTLSAGGTATVAYTAQNGTQSAKVTFAVASNGAGFQWEQFDVVAVPSQAGGAAVNFVVSNRVKGTTSIPDTVVTAIMVDGQIQISLTLDAVQTSGGTATFDAVEFGLMVD